MAVDRKSSYDVLTLVNRQASALKDYSELSEHYKGALGDFTRSVQNYVNRMILLERENKTEISEQRWILINAGASAMTKSPKVASIIAEGFSATAR